MASFVLGVTGPIASGKDSAALFFRGKGFAEIDVDRVGHLLLDEKKEQLAALFGEEIIVNGSVERALLGAKVFASQEKMELLNRTLHPAMCVKVKEYLQSIKGPALINAALLYPMKLDSLCDKVFYITAPEKVRMQRLIERDALSKDEALLRFSRQKEINRFIKNADIVVENRSSKSAFLEQLALVAQSLLQGVNYGAAEQSEGDVYP